MLTRKNSGQTETMKQSLNLQQTLGDVNPLFKKFCKEGENPTTYIPVDKRREIYDYMGRVTYTKGVLSK